MRGATRRGQPRHVAPCLDVARRGARAAFLRRHATGHVGGFHFTWVAVAGLDGGFGDGGMIAKNPSAEITSHAIARKTERITRTFSAGRSVIREKSSDCGSGSLSSSLSCSCTAASEASLHVGAALFARRAQEARRIIHRLQRRGLKTHAMIARALNARGVSTPGLGRPWTGRSVSRVLMADQRARRPRSRKAKPTLH